MNYEAAIFATNVSPIFAAAMFGLVVMSLAVVIALLRLWMGPSLPDRVVALDMIATLLVGLLVLYAIAQSEAHPLRVATVLALVNFIGTIGFSLYLRRKTAS